MILLDSWSVWRAGRFLDGWCGGDDFGLEGLCCVSDTAFPVTVDEGGELVLPGVFAVWRGLGAKRSMEDVANGR